MSWRGFARTAAIALLAVMLPALPAGAHAYLVRSTPAHRAVLGQVPERAQLWFNERLEPAYSMVSVWNQAGTQVDGRDVMVGPNDPRRLSVSIEARAPGAYTVKYRVLSVDGHVVDSQLTFTVKGTRS